jgi:hypothetical protein
MLFQQTVYWDRATRFFRLVTYILQFLSSAARIAPEIFTVLVPHAFT